MAICPLSKRYHPRAYFCFEFTDASTCQGCLAWDRHARWALIRRSLAMILRAILPAFLVLPLLATACGGMAHNGLHYSASLAGDIATGLAGGTYYATVDYSRVTWTDGRTFAVFINGVLRTMYEVRTHGQWVAEHVNGYVLKDAAVHAAQVVSATRAIQHLRQLNALGAAGSVAVGLLPAAVLCGLYPQLAAGVIECQAELSQF